MDTDIKTSRKEATHERILEAAARAIRQGGYAGASVADVMKEAGLTHGGFYAHFESRDAMVAEAIEHAGMQNVDSVARRMTALQRRGASPFRSLIETYLSEQHLQSPEGGCVVAALGSEMARQPEIVRQASCKRVMGLVSRVEAVLPEGVDGAQAAVIASAMVGTLQMARALDEKEGKALLASNRKALLERYEAAGGAPA
jgi:TetR/AcrR family transcriptional repressor of nem operon